MLSRTVIAIFSTASLIPWVAPQATTNVTCSASSLWMQNADAQNPCLVSAYLSSVCNKGLWFVPTLIQGAIVYSPPVNEFANSCRCNTVAYSLLQACSTCQGGGIETWTTWIARCPSAFVGKTYPNTVPGPTVIPGWATLDPTAGNTWDATLAHAYAASGASGAPSTGGKKKSNAGAIVGGVIGSLVGLALIGFLIWLYFQRSSRGKGQKVTHTPHKDPGLFDPDSPIHDTGGSVEKNQGHLASMGVPALMMMATPPPIKPYDPLDPSISSQSPDTTATFIGQSSSSGCSPYPGGAYSDTQLQASYPPYQIGPPRTCSRDPQLQQQQPQGGYAGVVEV